ncbi:MAG: hypothetical protein DMD91_19100 [Candidatus Rokuibacteriota bacterium]|nr:MAG: hypothetical protein DMD91_19100 [Candidatus Rokubacteria bacterium]
MRRMISVFAMGAIVAWALPAGAADESKVKAAAGQVESGAKKIGDGKLGDGVEDTAKGIGKTVVESAKFTGEKFKEAGKAAEPPVKGVWGNLKEGNVKESANQVGATVKNFFGRLFSN